MKSLLLLLAACSALALSASGQVAGDYLFPRWPSSPGPLSPVWVTPDSGKLLGFDNTGLIIPMTAPGGDWSTITGKPTTLAGYGITDSITAATAAATYAPLSHTQAWSTITSTPTTLAGYGISDGLTETLADTLYAALVHSHAFSDLTGKPTTLAGYGITDGLTAATAAASYQPQDATLTALAALNSTSGVLYQTGADAFSKVAATAGSWSDPASVANQFLRLNGSGYLDGLIIDGALFVGSPSSTRTIVNPGSLAFINDLGGELDLNLTPLDDSAIVVNGPPQSGNLVVDTTLPPGIGIACSDESSALTTGTKATFRMPRAMTLSECRASVGTAPTGARLIIDIKENGTTIFSELLSVDAGEKTSTTADNVPIISDADLADDAEITISITQIGSSVAGAGLKVWLIGTFHVAE